MKLLALCLASCLALAACGGSDNVAPTSKEHDALLEEVRARKPPESNEAPKSRTVRITAETKQVLLDRLEIIKKITLELKPLIVPERDPDGALGKEEALATLFIEYRRLGQLAADDGLTPTEMGGLTAELAADDWYNTRNEFSQFLLLVRQLGEPQLEMIDRVMGTGDPAATAQPE